MLYHIHLLLIVYLFALSGISFFFRKRYDTTHLFAFALISFAFLSEGVMKICAILFHNNIPIYNLSGFTEFLLVNIYFIYYLGSKYNNVFKSLILLVFLISFGLEIVHVGLFQMLKYCFLLKNIILVILSIIAFKQMLDIDKNELITNSSFFWINTAVLIYYTGTLLIFGIRNLANNFHLLDFTLFSLHLLFIYIYYTLLFIGLWKASRK